MSDSEVKKVNPGLYFMGLIEEDFQYPAWRYHKYREPIIVRNKDEDKDALKLGWETLDAPRQAVPQLLNYRWDLEDLTPEQIAVWAKEEYDIDLPPEIGKEKLVKLCWKLAREAPENRERVVLMAQTIKLNYDATLEEIRKAVEGRTDLETVTLEFEA